MDNKEKIIAYLSKSQATVKEIAEYLDVSRQAVHRLLNTLIMDGELSKVGEPPKVFYSVKQKQTTQLTQVGSQAATIDSKTRGIIEDSFLYISPFGKKLAGWDGFVTWCNERNQDLVKMSELYVSTVKKYGDFRIDGRIDGMQKIRSTFDDVALDGIYYLDFYNYEIFGKTKLGQLLLFAKQSQDKALMNELIDNIKPDILSTIESFKVDGVAFIPPTVRREHQLMKQLQQRLNLDIRIIPLVKVKTQVIVPQKTLSKLADRVINARETIVVDDTSSYTNILLIDDAVGSGATLNEVAKKIRKKGICTGKIIGLAITGSANGFDVISEV